METTSARVRELLAQIGTLDDELRDALHAQQSRIQFAIDGRRVAFTRDVRAVHRQLRTELLRFLRHSQPRNVLTAPIIYAMIVPLVLLDAAVTLYQTVSFPLYGLARVPRSRYIVMDRHHLGYLNAIEKVNCAYCSYANGLLAYAREVVARTEQYWCPIKHAHHVLGTHARHAEFLDFGDGEGWVAGLEHQRQRLRSERQRADPVAPHPPS